MRISIRRNKPTTIPYPSSNPSPPLKSETSSQSEILSVPSQPQISSYQPEISPSIPSQPEILPPVPSQPEILPPVLSQPEIPPPVPSLPEILPSIPSQPEILPPVPSLPEILSIRSQPEILPPVPSQSEILPPVPSQPEILPPVLSQPEIPPPVLSQPEILPPVPSQSKIPPPVSSQSEILPPVPSQPEILPPVPSLPEIPPPVSSIQRNSNHPLMNLTNSERKSEVGSSSSLIPENSPTNQQLWKIFIERMNPVSNKSNVFQHSVNVVPDTSKTYQERQQEQILKEYSDFILKFGLSSYRIEKWVEYPYFWLYNTDQRDPDWLLVKKGRPSGSNCGKLLGHSNPAFGSPEEEVLSISGKGNKNFTPEQLDNMNHGTLEEPIAREYLSKKLNVSISELGFVVPKWNLYIGVSVDGVITLPTGEIHLVEIKCPKKMYGPLKSYMEKQASGTCIPNDYSHIWKSHYDQMQLGMAIYQAKICYYLVYCSAENSVFLQPVPFNQNYWINHMYNPLCQIVDHQIKPLLADTPFPLMPPSSKN